MQKTAICSLGCALVLAVACMSDDTISATDALVEELDSRVKAAKLAPSPTKQEIQEGMRVDTTASHVVPGLAYYEASFRPRGSHDVTFTALVGNVAARRQQLRSVPDWNELVKHVAWAPRNETDAISACKEVLQVVGPGRGHRLPPVVYEDASSLDDSVALISASAAETVRRVAAPPAASFSGNEWSVRIWEVGTERSTQYLCRLRAVRGADASSTTAISLVETDSVAAGQLGGGV